LKKRLRARILNRLSSIGREERAKKSLAIKKKIFALPEFKRARRIMFYIPKDNEVDTGSMIKQSIQLGKEVIVPAILPDRKELASCRLKDYQQELTRGPYGVYQPEVTEEALVNPEEIDLFIIPGLVFDAKGNRLGRGRGYYDRFLARLPQHIPRIGVAFRFQMVDDLPCDEYDQPVDRLVSD
jgi:5-formyltetrahydrofolate cyclo-ligase